MRTDKKKIKKKRLYLDRALVIAIVLHARLDAFFFILFFTLRCV